MTMHRRKIGNIVITDDDRKLFSATIWGNVWSYNDKIWYGLFFNCNNIRLIRKFNSKLQTLGFKKKIISSQYGRYYKYQITGTKSIFNNYIDYADGQMLSIDIHTVNGLKTYKLELNIKEKSDYIYNEKVLDAL